MASEGASAAARPGRLSTKDKPPSESSRVVSHLAECRMQMRMPIYERAFRLKGGTNPAGHLARHLGERVRKNCRVSAVAHDAASATVTFTDGPDAKPQESRTTSSFPFHPGHLRHRGDTRIS